MEATVTATTTTTSTMSEVFGESIRLSFMLDGDSKKKFIRVPILVAMTIPVVERAMLFGGKEKENGTYPLGVRNFLILKHYLAYKKSLMDKTELPRVLGLDIPTFIATATLAHELGDMNFFSRENLEMLFPDYDSVTDSEIIDMPEEAMIFYVEKYLEECFYSRACKCEHAKYVGEKSTCDAIIASQSGNKELGNYLSALETLVYWMTSDEKIDKNKYKLLLKLVRSGLVYRWCKSIEDDDERFEIFQSYLEPLGIEIDKYGMLRLEEIPIDERKKVLSLYLMGYRYSGWSDEGFKQKEKKICTEIHQTKCTCAERPFYNRWSAFCTKRSLLADFLWKFMDRQNILDIANIYPGHVKYNKMKTIATLEDLNDYVETFKPKITEIDPIERDLREKLRLAKKGEKVGRSSRYYDSDKIAQCEAALSRYLGEKTRKSTRAKAINAVKLWEAKKYGTSSDTIYTNRLKNVGNKFGRSNRPSSPTDK